MGLSRCGWPVIVDPLPEPVSSNSPPELSHHCALWLSVIVAVSWRSPDSVPLPPPPPPPPPQAARNTVSAVVTQSELRTSALPRRTGVGTAGATDAPAVLVSPICPV